MSLLKKTNKDTVLFQILSIFFAVLMPDYKSMRETEWKPLKWQLHSLSQLTYKTNIEANSMQLDSQRGVSKYFAMFQNVLYIYIISEKVDILNDYLTT